MTDKAITKKSQLSDDAIIKVIGNFIRHHRLEQNMSQRELAEKSGINRTTLYDIELGRRCNLLTLIQILRTLDLLSVLSDFQVNPQISPIKLAKLEMEKRKRASKSDGAKNNSKSDW